MGCRLCPLAARFPVHGAGAGDPGVHGCTERGPAVRWHIIHMKRKGILTPATMGTNPVDITSGETSETQSDNNFLISVTGGPQSHTFVQPGRGKVRGRERLVGTEFQFGTMRKGW